jgi:prepilin-type N-terminal cleavage/methylation domain-containing protein
MDLSPARSYKLQAAEAATSHKPQATSGLKLEAWSLALGAKERLGAWSLKLEAPAARPRARGFTLVEIMVVVVILGILAVLVVPRVVGRTDEARAAAARHDIAAIMQALKLYRLDNGRYPTNEQGLPALVSKPQSPPQPSNWK